MTRAKLPDGVKLESIFHPSDFSEASEVAFVHALKIALVAGGKLGAGTRLDMEHCKNGRTSQASATRSSDGGSSRKIAPRAIFWAWNASPPINTCGSQVRLQPQTVRF
jgi:hypothetical protein